MDWRIFHAVNDRVGDGGVAHAFDVLTTIGVVALVAGALALLLVPRLRAAALAALASGALAFAINQLIHALHDRARPYEAHRGVAHPYANGMDASFPSDHASAAFGIAWLIFLVDRTIGALFLAAAAVVAVGRVVTGAHYPGDVLAGALVGLGSALVVRRFVLPLLARQLRRRFA
jgi:undecaprenyl-diphosphatase